jgi:hypothetical protein
VGGEEPGRPGTKLAFFNDTYPDCRDDALGGSNDRVLATAPRTSSSITPSQTMPVHRTRARYHGRRSIGSVRYRRFADVSKPAFGAIFGGELTGRVQPLRCGADSGGLGP